jgi:hypothetical protein
MLPPGTRETAGTWLKLAEFLGFGLLTEMNRRSLLAGAALFVLLQSISPVLADGGDNDGGGNGGSGGGDNSGSGGDDDDDSDDDSSGSGNSGDGKHGTKDQYLAHKAVAKGSAVSLLKLKTFLAKNYPGKILKLNLEKRPGGYIYQVRILQQGNRVKNLTLDARTLQRSVL